MHIEKLTDVPEHILIKQSDIKKNKNWESDYNIAAWFRFKQQSFDLVRLHIQWRDDGGLHTSCVDQTTVNSASLLMSGIARVQVTGHLKAMSILVETNNLSFTVDELFVQPARHVPLAKQAL